jgi:hypothetical protein
MAGSLLLCATARYTAHADSPSCGSPNAFGQRVAVGDAVAVADEVGDGDGGVVAGSLDVDDWVAAGTVTDEPVADVPSPPEHPDTSATARSADVQHAAALAPHDRAHRIRTRLSPPTDRPWGSLVRTTVTQRAGRAGTPRGRASR